MQKKYQVFVSSTFRDLVEERQDAIRSILDLGHIPAGMELFPAADTEQLSYIKKVIDECDYYVLIMGGRYGSLDYEGVSFTEREYDYAVATGKIVLAFPHGDLAAIPVGKSDTGDRMRSNLEQFRAKVMTGRLVREWTSREQLEALVVKSLVRAVSDYPATGWIRGNAAASEDILQQLNTLRIELERVSEENFNLRRSVEPSIVGLAAENEVVSLRFTYRVHIRGSGVTTRDKSFEFSWHELFLAISKGIAVPKVTGKISALIANHLKENRGASTTYSLYDSDLAIVKNQLSALGLINAYVAKGMDGALHEFMSLTDLGRGRLTEALAVKSPSMTEIDG